MKYFLVSRKAIITYELTKNINNPMAIEGKACLYAPNKFGLNLIFGKLLIFIFILAK